MIILAEVVNNNEVGDGASNDEEEDFPAAQESAAEAMRLIHFGDFFESHCNVIPFFSHLINLESYTVTERLNSKTS